MRGLVIKELQLSSWRFLSNARHTAPPEGCPAEIEACCRGGRGQKEPIQSRSVKVSQGKIAVVLKRRAVGVMLPAESLCIVLH